MNGPGITTLPDVAADAGLTLYVILIALSVTMAAFVCRRMVYAMWASLDNSDEAVSGDVEHHGEGNYQDYQSNKTIEHTGNDGSVQNLSTSDDKAASTVSEEGEMDEIIPVASSADKLTHRTDHHNHGAGATTDEEPHSEVETLLSHKDHDENMAIIANDHDRGRPVLERTSIVGQSREAYGKKASVYTAFTMVASALCLGLAQMMVCAAILDGLLVALTGKSCALGLPSEDNDSSFLYCTTHASMKPFAGSGAPTSLISIGWVIAASASVALGSVDLDEIISVQYFLFGCLVVSACRFSIVLKGMADGLDANGGVEVDAEVDNTSSNTVSWLVGPNPFQTVGPIMFNFAFIVTSPPSVAMARAETIAAKALGMSCIVMGTLYTIVGLSGASVSNAVRSGMIKGGDDSNLLSLILLSGGESGGPSMLDLCFIGLFGFSTIASVPVYCLLAKDTLINDAGVAPLPSFLLSNVLPWILVALTYNAAFFEAFVNWSGLLILGYANFSVPLLLDLKLKKVRASRALGQINKRIHGDDGNVTSITRWVLLIVTASITVVIAISILG